MPTEKEKVQFFLGQMHTHFEPKKKSRKKPEKYPVPDWVKERFFKAHYDYSCIYFPNVVKDGHYQPPIMPDYQTANGLTSFITKYAKWMGGTGNNLQVMGRQVNGKYIKASTNKGTADTIVQHPVNGVSFYAEVKVGKDKPREEQLREQARIRRAGGIYEFVHTPMDFLELWDKVGSIQVVRAGDLFANS